MGIAMPARQAMLNDIVSTDGLMNAISLNFMGMNALQLIVPTVAGFLITDFDFKAVYYVMTAFFLTAVVLFAFVPRTGIRSDASRSALADIKDGLRYAWKDSTIRSVLFISFTVVIISSPWGLLAPFFVDKILHVGAEGMGILLSVSGAGAGLRIVNTCAARAVVSAYHTVSNGISSCAMTACEESMIDRAASTSARMTRAFAPGATTIVFWPLSSTSMMAIPVAAESSVVT